MKVIKCDRCGEICSIGRGVTFTHNNGSTADLCPDCYDKFNLWLKQKEPKQETAEQPEKRMTCKNYCSRHLYNAADCEKCWSQPVPEGVE